MISDDDLERCVHIGRTLEEQYDLLTYDGRTVAIQDLLTLMSLLVRKQFEVDGHDVISTKVDVPNKPIIDIQITVRPRELRLGKPVRVFP